MLSLLALNEPFIDSWIYSPISLLPFLPFEEYPNSSLMDSLMSFEPDEAPNYSLIDYLIPLYDE